MRIKNKVVGMALALGAAVAPLAVKANTETNATPKAVELSKAEKATKLKEAIHLGLPREELLKYVDFPEWIPVTPDGKYDLGKANEMFNAAGLNKSENQKAFQDYMFAVEKGANPDIEFQKFAKQITGGDTEKMAAVNQIKDALQKTQESTEGKEMTNNFTNLCLAAYLAVIVSCAFIGTKMEKDGFKTLGSIMKALGIVAGVITGIAISGRPDLRNFYQDTGKQLHKIYANQEIQKAANPKIVQMDMQQAKQFIEMAKQNGPVK